MADNPDELFDIVDGSDRIVGTGRRADVHANGWLHRAVHIMVVNEDGDVFLQKRSISKDCHPGLWDSSASGHLDSGEDYGDAALREVQEELGVTVDGVELIGKLPASEMTGQEFVRIYRTQHSGPFELHPEEIETGRWIKPEELDAWIARAPHEFAPCFLLVWSAAKYHL